MKNVVRNLQHGMTASVLAVALFVTGAAALAATDTGGGPDMSTPSGGTTSSSDLAVGSQLVVPVADAGVVTITRDTSRLSLVSAMGDPGWQTAVGGGSDREIEVSFRSSTTRHDVNLELEDGAVRIRIRTQAVSGSSATASTSTTSTGPTSTTSTSTSTSSPSTTSTTSTTLAPATSTTWTTPSTSSAPSSSNSTTVPTSTTTPTSTTVPNPSTTTGPSTPDRTEVVNSTGGTVTVTISGNHLTLVSAVSSPGYEADIRNGGGSEIDVRFERGDRESRIRLRASNGSLRREVENR